MKKIAITLLALASATAALNASATWVRGQNGSVPMNAWQVGSDSDGEELYLCRARFNNGMHPGKLRQDFDGCHISYAGREVSVANYQVYIGQPMGRFIMARNGMIPGNAMPIGLDSDGRELFLCRARYAGQSMQPGKVRPGFNGCNIAYDGREVTVPNYFVFVRAGGNGMIQQRHMRQDM